MRPIRPRAQRALIATALLVGVLWRCAALPLPPLLRLAPVGAVGPQTAVYTPVELRRALTRSPALWIGRVVWIRARAVQTFAWTCQHDYLCVVRQPSLADPAVDAADARLPLVLLRADSVLALARRAPLVGPVVARLAPPATIPWDTIALYHVQLVAPPTCSDVTCVVARMTGDD